MIDDRTQHGDKTKYGFKTPHKYPSAADDDFQQLSNLVDELYPTGRAWYAPKGGAFDELHNAINLSFLRYIEKYRNLINKSIPDNDDFNADDAEFLEYKYGINTNENVDLELRKAALRRKIGHPNNIKPRQDAIFLEKQLQLSGFNVYVHENQTPYQTPSDVANQLLDATQHGGGEQHGSSTFHGGNSFEVIANKINVDESYGVGGNLWASFFIGGQNLGESANVPENRQREFRELVLKLKPAHLAAYIFINFI